MTARELMEAWEKFPFLGRISLLLRSGFMREEYPEDDQDFIDALNGLSKTEFAQLPWALQDEFGRYVETPNFQNWIKKGGESDGGKIGDGG